MVFAGSALQGSGKTAISLAVILATRGQMPPPPPLFTVRPLARSHGLKKGVSLIPLVSPFCPTRPQEAPPEPCMLDPWPAGVPSLAYLAARALRFRGNYRALLDELPEGAGDVLRRCPPPQVISHVRPGVSRRMCVAARTKGGAKTFWANLGVLTPATIVPRPQRVRGRAGPAPHVFVERHAGHRAVQPR